MLWYQITKNIIFISSSYAIRANFATGFEAKNHEIVYLDK